MAEFIVTGVGLIRGIVRYSGQLHDAEQELNFSSKMVNSIEIHLQVVHRTLRSLPKLVQLSNDRKQQIEAIIDDGQDLLTTVREHIPPVPYTNKSRRNVRELTSRAGRALRWVYLDHGRIITMYPMLQDLRTSLIDLQKELEELVKSARSREPKDMPHIGYTANSILEISKGIARHIEVQRRPMVTGTAYSIADKIEIAERLAALHLKRRQI